MNKIFDKVDKLLNDYPIEPIAFIGLLYGFILIIFNLQVTKDVIVCSTLFFLWVLYQGLRIMLYKNENIKK